MPNLLRRTPARLSSPCRRRQSQPANGNRPASAGMTTNDPLRRGLPTLPATAGFQTTPGTAGDITSETLSVALSGEGEFRGCERTSDACLDHQGDVDNSDEQPGRSGQGQSPVREPVREDRHHPDGA